MHSEALDFLRRVRGEHPRLFLRSRVLECGSYEMNGSPRDLFQEASYTGLDWRAGPGVDEVCLVHDYRPAQPFDVVLSMEMLEHDPHWQRSLQAMIGFLAPGGALLLTWAAPGRAEHEVDCAPQAGYYRGLSANEVFEVVASAPVKWHTVQVAQTRGGLDCQLLAVKPAVSVIVGAVGQAALTSCCIQEVRRLARLPVEIVLIDNGSSPRESELLARINADVVLRSDEMLGFPRANNLGVTASSGKYVLLLNNDAWPTQAGWDARLVSVLEGVPGAQIVAATASRVSSPDQRATGPQKSDCELVETTRVLFVAVLLRRSTLDAVGPLDERFGLGNYEDDDYCLRVQEVGGRIIIDPATYFFHVGSVTMRTLDFDALLEANRKFFEEKWSVDP